MKKVAVILLALLAVSMLQGHPTNAQTNEIKLPRLWEHSLRRWGDCYQRGGCLTYFHCSYTAQTCEDGVRVKDNSMFIFILVDGNDRDKVIDLRACSPTFCFSFKTGQMHYRRRVTNEQPPRLSEDLPEDCEPAACEAWIRKRFNDWMPIYP